MPIRPETLTPGSAVRIVSPSLPAMALARAHVDRGLVALEELGLRVEFSSNCFAMSDDAVSAGDPRDRAADINEAFADPGVKAIICSVGGSTTQELLPFLDVDLIRKHPKIFIGRSDNIYLNGFLLEKADLVSFYGVSFLPQFCAPSGPIRETVSSFVGVLMNKSTFRYPHYEKRQLRTFRWAARSAGELQTNARIWSGERMWLGEGTATGLLVGGELSLVVDMASKGLVDLRGKIFFWDSTLNDLERIKDDFSKLHEMFDLRSLRGIVIADNSWFQFDEWFQFLAQLISDVLGDVKYPLLVGADCGHFEPIWVLPYGDTVTLDSPNGLTYRGDQN